MRSASLLPLLLVGFLAALTYWLERAAQVGDFGRHAEARHDPDYYVDRFRVRRYDDNGALLNTLVAEKMLHFPDDDSTQVLSPRMTYRVDSPTVVTAKTAWLDKDGKHVRLEGDVRVVRSGRPREADTVVTTSRLYLTPDDELARTDTPVTITQGRSVVTGSGGSVDNKARKTVLTGRVHGIIHNEKQSR